MTPLVPLAMFSWIPLALWLFSRLKAGHAVIAGFLISWMFLPQYSYSISGLPDYSKVSAMSCGVLLGTLIFNRRVLETFRPHLVDLPMFAWCTIPFLTSISNGLGAYDGVSVTVGRVTMWGLPYFIGRLYFNNRRTLAELAFGIFLGGLIYIPFCLFEVVMSPRLHRIIYGFHPHDFGQSRRWGGWRPVVFMQHGLMTAMWMVTAFLSGYQLWRSRWLSLRLPAYNRIWGWSLIGLAVTVVLCKSTGAIGLAVLGFLILYSLRRVRWSFPLYILLSLPVLYVLARGTGYWDGQNLIDAVSKVANSERTGSLAFRLDNENILAEKAKQRVLLGWGEWGRSFVRAPDGEILSVPDGLWILAFGKNGVLGLSALLLTLLLPPLLFLKLYPVLTWQRKDIAAICALPLLMILFTIDSLFNDMFNPLMLMLGGGINGMWLNRGDRFPEAGNLQNNRQIEPLPALSTRLF